ncbi:MAG: HPr kinase/phosphatase C-terminal domain-containing protein [Yoonia sp.]|uniref:HPr kinase/phosphorylase n=1 Tax=Yoonia sp. TaxID=2212373 RepID=UPI00273D7CFC|nr:HPr kinase/phosphatase C-terminal domain-containing protein [Yoonia sp.]MDP5086320.1 HPr kinase/phosphatase C-terminal domain-containing protein [Yoonia sp.]
MTGTQSLHATCVAWDGLGVMVTGASGSGKSALGLTLMGFGCTLVADDRVRLSVAEGSVIAQCPATISGLIEARGVGILNAAHVPQAKVALVVDLDKSETARLPQPRTITLLGCDLPLIYRVESPHFAASILQILKGGWSDR